MVTRKPLYLIDASIYVFRAYYSLPDSMADSAGNPVNAIYGFAGFLHGLLKQSNGSHYAVAFDESLTSSIRNKLYPGYKANREPAPADLKYQFKQCQKLASHLGLATFSSKKYEADDILGTIANKTRNRGFKMIIVSSDKDLSQIMQAGDIFWDYSRDLKVSVKNAASRFDIKPSQIVDLLALMGDSIDNIPGIPGIGKKTALQLLRHFKSLDGVYANLKKIPTLNIRGSHRVAKLLAEHQQLAYLSKQLATIIDNVPISCAVSTLAKKKVNSVRLSKLCDQLGFGDGLRTRLLNLS